MAQQQQAGGAASAATAAAPASRTPADFLRSIRGKPVVVRLNSGADYRGVLACLDGYMNVALEQTEEYVGGQLKNSYGDAFLRGNNVLYIAAADGSGGVGSVGGGGAGGGGGK